MNARRSSIIAITALMAVLFAPGSLWSWGRLGHRASTLLAYKDRKDWLPLCRHPSGKYLPSRF
jgi:hypothetical protein